MTLEGVDRHVEGSYVCTADNGIGESASATMSVIVRYPPEIFTEKVCGGSHSKGARKGWVGGENGGRRGKKKKG